MCASQGNDNESLQNDRELPRTAVSFQRSPFRTQRTARQLRRTGVGVDRKPDLCAISNAPRGQQRACSRRIEKIL